MSQSPGLMLICVGVLGLAQIGGLWLAVRFLDAGFLHRLSQGGLIGHRRRWCVGRLVQVAPLLVLVLSGLVIAGMFLRWSEAS